MNPAPRHDVVILGAGLAGLALARQLLLETERSVLLVERRDQVPPERQKVGESLVQVGGFYFSKVLELEEYLLRNHYLKYNLRFYWPSAGRANDRFEDFSQSYIRGFSNVASYQLDRNAIEAELLRRNLESDRFAYVPGARELEVDLEPGEADHRVRIGAGGEAVREVAAGWVVDTTGRGKFLARRLELGRENPIRHGAFFWWVDGLVDIDRLTDLSPRQVRKKPERRHQGHLPVWLATNHFMGEGYWFWVIPLQGKTSLGLVFDREVIDPKEVFSVEKATAWVCRELPLFARDLPEREVLDFGGFRDFSYDCKQTISADRWALAGEAGRFSDPLYSPGSDLIAIYNTLIVDAIEHAGDGGEAPRAALAEQVMQSVYSAYVPSYATSYDALGDQEVFSLKYVWELSVYFACYVFPFLNDLFTDRRFALAFLRQFARLGPMNAGVQRLLSDYFQWKKENRPGPAPRVFFDFTEIGTLAAAEKTFYEVGVTVPEAREILSRQVENLEELARFVEAHVAAAVLGDPAVATSRRFVGAIDPARLAFDPDGWAERWAGCAAVAPEEEPWEWRLVDPAVMARFAGEAAVAGAGA